MKAHRAGLLCSAVVIVSAVGGCMPLPGVPSQGNVDVIGVLGASGQNVFVNGRPAPTGTTIYPGDEVSTGAGSSARVEFVTGGYFQLDQNTDPQFVWDVIAGVRCIVVRIFSGQGYGEGSGTCIQTQGATAVLSSIAVVRTTGGQSTITLLEGRAIVIPVGQSRQTVLTPGQEVTAITGQPALAVRSLQVPELNARSAWRTSFRFQGWCGDVRNSSDQCPGRFSVIQPGTLVRPPPTGGGTLVRPPPATGGGTLVRPPPTTGGGTLVRPPTTTRVPMPTPPQRPDVSVPPQQPGAGGSGGPTTVRPPTNRIMPRPMPAPDSTPMPPIR